MSRTPPSLKTKLASALLQIVRYDDEEGCYVPVIPYAESKGLTADQIIARFHFDHGIAEAHDGPTQPWNLTPLPVAVHRKKTAKIDVPRIAKSKRIARRQAEHSELMQMDKSGVIDGVSFRKGHRVLVRKIPSRPFPKGSRPIQSRGFR